MSHEAFDRAKFMANRSLKWVDPSIERDWPVKENEIIYQTQTSALSFHFSRRCSRLNSSERPASAMHQRNTTSRKNRCMSQACITASLDERLATNGAQPSHSSGDDESMSAGPIRALTIEEIAEMSRDANQFLTLTREGQHFYVDVLYKIYLFDNVAQQEEQRFMIDTGCGRTTLSIPGDIFDELHSRGVTTMSVNTCNGQAFNIVHKVALRINGKEAELSVFLTKFCSTNLIGMDVLKQMILTMQGDNMNLEWAT